MSTPTPETGPVFFTAPDAYGDATIWRHVDGGDPVACANRYDVDPDLWTFLTRIIPAGVVAS